MKRARLLIGAALALSSVWAVAQDAPESLLPPGFDKPAPRQGRTPAPAPTVAGGASSPGGSVSTPVVQALPGKGSSGDGAAAAPAAALPANLPSIKQLEAMSPEELDQLLGLRPKYDVPAAARRSLKFIGVVDEGEGGFGAGSFSAQSPVLMRAALSGNEGALVSRWGHILLRRVLASRLDTPGSMGAADFAALRAALLVRMGEGEAARALVQDIDAANYTPALTQAALDAYLATADLTGICPSVAVLAACARMPIGKSPGQSALLFRAKAAARWRSWTGLPARS